MVNELQKPPHTASVVRQLREIADQIERADPQLVNWVIRTEPFGIQAGNPFPVGTRYEMQISICDGVGKTIDVQSSSKATDKGCQLLIESVNREEQIAEPGGVP